MPYRCLSCRFTTTDPRVGGGICNNDEACGFQTGRFQWEEPDYDTDHERESWEIQKQGLWAPVVLLVILAAGYLIANFG